ncbi:transferrin-binding protein-like solute binding protein, partial [Kingella kingae]
PTPPAPTPTPPAPTPTPPSSNHTGFGMSNNGVMTKQLDGGVLTTSGSQSQYEDFGASALEAPTASDKNSVNLNGVAISTKEVTAGKFTTSETSVPNSGRANIGKALHSGNLLENVRYGAVAHFKQANDIKQALFVQGAPTAADTVKAQSGTVTYQGEGLHFGQASRAYVSGVPFDATNDSFAISPTASNAHSNARVTDVKATVNFGSKNITIDITAPTESGRPKGLMNATARDLPANGIKLNGKIQGNSFKSNNGETTVFAGGFFGNNADELAGMYANEAKRATGETLKAGDDGYYTGVFGAKKAANNSSGGGSTKPVAPAPQPQPQPQPPMATDAKSSLQYIVDTATKALSTVSGTFDNLRIVRVDGVDITLPAQDSSKTALIEATNYRIFNNLDNVVYGAASGNGKHALFVQGDLTADMPSGGNATYKGQVLHYRGRVLNNPGVLVGSNIDYTYNGTFTATADFANKTLSADINSGDSSFMGKRTFNAVINGNRFASDSSSPNHKIEGGFYGAGAAEIAGKYEFVDDKNKSELLSNSGFGVFGGKKQTQ